MDPANPVPALLGYKTLPRPARLTATLSTSATVVQDTLEANAADVPMDTTETHHRQEDRVCLATVTHSAVCMRVVTIRANVPAKKASQAEIVLSVHPDTSPLQPAAYHVLMDVLMSFLMRWRH